MDGDLTRTKDGAAAKKLSKAKAKDLARRDAARAAFSRFYEDVYGSERWRTLLPALDAPVRFCCLVNRFADPAAVVRALAPVAADLRRVPWLSPECLVVDSDDVASACPRPFPAPAVDILTGAKTHYLLDAASILATEALDVRPTDTVLDMCSAPGGKALCILQRLGPSGRLHANEPSSDRRTRLRKVLREYVPEDARCETTRNPGTPQIEVSGIDATRRNAFEPARYSRVLCDAPCSSERHVIQSSDELAQWTPGRTRISAKRQRLLLLAAIQSAQFNGGRIVYATCSLSPAENDGVVDWVLQKLRKKVNLHVVTHETPWPVGERTKFGWIALPDALGRWGPLYFCALIKGDKLDESGTGDDFGQDFGED
ncbi:NOL1/NOP2/Sun domain member 3 [Entophlyctis luteolus]|nr:NOL1/NOP2/Sun domain member 3 [Entophlyctis luteolus]KAJ3381679.1 NOL1/NOP2/Sun domain member 3 [Entophlyctis sp. JEL0112]